MSQEQTHETHQPRGEASLWTAVLGAPALWALQMQTNYVLAPWTCTHGKSAMYAVAIITLGLIAGGGVVSFIEWRKESDAAFTDDRLIDRGRFLALMGMMNSVLFFLLVSAQTLATVF